MFIIEEEESIISASENQFYSWSAETLRRRVKGQHLDYSEKARIYGLYLIDSLDLWDISNMYAISMSIINKIIKEFKNWKY